MRRRAPGPSPPKTRINERIRAREVRLIDAEGGQVGIVPIDRALVIAEDSGLDLVEVAPLAKPPVCRVMDYGKYLYQQKKKAQESKKKQKTFSVKEVKFRPRIGQHDYDLKLRNLIRFLGDGDKVKATVQFRGREKARTDLGYSLLERVVEDVGDVGVIESPPLLAGNRVHMVFGPSKKKVT